MTGYPPTFTNYQRGLFDPPAQPVDTSRAAAQAVKPKTAAIRERILGYVQRCGAVGATAGDIEFALDISGSTVRPRLRELEGTAPWAKGKLPQRIVRTPEKRGGMRVYVPLTPPGR